MLRGSKNCNCRFCTGSLFDSIVFLQLFSFPLPMSETPAVETGKTPLSQGAQSKTNTPLTKVQLYTDGGCSGNPGPGGWAYILRDPQTGKEKCESGAEPEATNNQMEIMAVIQGLESLKRPCRVELYSDSSYVGQGLSSWMAGWKKNGWRRKEGGKFKELKNAELWRRLDTAVSRHQLTFHHVRGHSGHPENERCDVMAVAAYQKYLR
jgi:ribonuclease HI